MDDQNKNNIENKGGEDGFSLLEVIIAIYIITVALVGIMTLLSQTTSSAAVSYSKLIAVHLAQEGIEVVRNIRDLNYGTNGWDDWYAGISGTTDYLVQYNDIALRSFGDTVLKYDSSTGLYGYDDGSNASFSFKRKITLSKISDAQIKVTAQVSWTEHGRSQSLTVEDRLWNWR
jgi:type II secretory pathway pseudopilin PulG